MPDLNIILTVMLFEAGALSDGITPSQQGQALISRIEQSCEQAMSAQEVQFDLTLSPFEAGLAINALTKGNSDLSRSLGQKLEEKLNEKLQELGVSYGQPSGGLDGQSSGLGSEQPSDTESGSEPASDNETEPSGDGSAATGDETPAPGM